MNKYSQLLKKLGLSAAALALSAALAVDSAAAEEADVNAEEGEEVVEDFDVDGFLEGIESEAVETAPEEETVTEATEEVSTRAAEEVAEVEQDKTIAQPEEVLGLNLSSNAGGNVLSSYIRVYINLDWRVKELTGTYLITNSNGQRMDDGEFKSIDNLQHQIVVQRIREYPDGIYTITIEGQADEQDNNQKFADTFTFTVKDGKAHKDLKETEEASEEPEVEAPTPEEPQEPEVTPEPAPEEEKEPEKTPEPEQPADKVDEEKPAADKKEEQQAETPAKEKPATDKKEEQQPETPAKEEPKEDDKKFEEKKEESFDDLRPLEELPLGGHASSFDKNGFPINWSEAKKQAYIEKFGLPKGADKQGSVQSDKQDSELVAKRKDLLARVEASDLTESAKKQLIEVINDLKLENVSGAETAFYHYQKRHYEEVERQKQAQDKQQQNDGQKQAQDKQQDTQKREARGERLPDTATGAWALGAVGLSTILAGFGVKKFKKD